MNPRKGITTKMAGTPTTVSTKLQCKESLQGDYDAASFLACSSSGCCCNAKNPRKGITTNDLCLTVGFIEELQCKESSQGDYDKRSLLDRWLHRGVAMQRILARGLRLVQPVAHKQVGVELK